MRWTKEEEEYLLKHFSSSDIKVIAKTLGRSEGACKTRHASLKRKMAKKNKGKTAEEVWLKARASTQFRAKRKSSDTRGTIESSKVAPQPTNSGRGGNAYRHTRTGFRADLGITVRSGWEANVCRLLNAYGIPFEYEPKVFMYPVKRGNKSYKPDLYLPNTDEWVEIKGYLDPNSKVKMKRFKLHYPDEWSRLTMIISGSDRKTNEFCEKLKVPNVITYRSLRKIYKDKIPNWEGK